MDDYIEVHNDIAKGGDWLRAARTWMQSNVPRGDMICWGDRQPVTVPFAALEDLARAAATAAVLAERRKKLHDEALRLAVERTRDDLGPEGTNYPAVRKLLDFAERAIEAGRA